MPQVANDSVVPTGVATLESFETIRRQESVFILLNLGILAALVVVHILFRATIDRPSRLMISLLLGRFAWQGLELVWLQAMRKPLGPKATRTYAVGTVVVHVTFGITAALLSGIEHGHYVVLLILPTIAAAFRFGWLGTLAIVSVASINTLLEVRIHYADAPSPMRTAEFFEAATAVLVFAAIAIFVHGVARQLREKQTSLEISLAQLAAARDELIEKEKLAAVGRLSAAVAHEIRNPVALITSAVASAKRTGYKPSECAKMCDVLESESDRLAKLTEEFLTYTRQKRPARKPTSVRTTLDYVAGLVRPMAESQRVEVRVEFTNDFEASFDAFQMHQALLNLASNAVEAAEEGKVTLRAQPEGEDGVSFSIRNSGSPIPEEARQQVFEPFFTTKPRGTGLGLAIAAKIAAIHGGGLRLATNAPDNVEFVLRIPPTIEADTK